MRQQDVTSKEIAAGTLAQAPDQRSTGGHPMTQWGLDVLFNPSKRHMDEERMRQQTTRDEAGDSSGGKRIDLESGRVVIQRHAAPDVKADADADKAGDSAELADSAAVAAADESGAAAELAESDADADVDTSDTD